MAGSGRPNSYPRLSNPSQNKAEANPERAHEFKPGIQTSPDAVEREPVNLQLDLATRNLENALLELRYIPDQPRVPAGNPDGGQWTDVGGSAGAKDKK